MSAVFIGISGWRYKGWRGVFYPQDLNQKEELHYASRRLSSIEINGSFYSLQLPSSYKRWYQDTPRNFIFSVKGNRFITHIKRLRDVEKPLANFFASGLFHLKEKLGPILWQFPPSFQYDPKIVEAFFRLLPKDLKEAQQLARNKDETVKGRSYLSFRKNRRLRHAMEIRNESFINPSFVELLRKYNVALVIADTAGKWPYKEDITADFVYIRLHGDAKLYASGYTEKALHRWADRIRLWKKGKEPLDASRIASKKATDRKSRNVYCYFDNDIKVKAPQDAERLVQLLSE